jgi:uncharacterized protein (DUF1015 family)
MAEILPVRGWRYNPEIFNDIEELTSPLFDVVSEKQRNALYKQQYNSIHISVPPHDAEEAGKTLEDWKKTKAIIQDPLPSIYVYYQYFKLPGSTKEYCRKGFICHIRAYDWEEQVILRHENTIPKSVNDRIAILEETEFHASATHGLYTDPTFELEQYMDEAILYPLYETEDYQGVRDVFAVIHDAKVIQRFINIIGEKKIILADGHHRYEGSLAYRKKARSTVADHARSHGFDYHLMYLTNTESDDLKILPTHRLISGLQNFDEKKIIASLEEDFFIREIEDSDTLNEIIAGKQWAFGLLFKESAYKARLKPEALSKLNWPFPEEVKRLDLTIMHYFIIEKALGIPGKEQRQSENISFDRSFSDCLKKIIQGEAQLAIITNEVSIEDVKRVCASGYTMPQKSTYFYPKVICGFVFSSIKEEEFQMPVYSPFLS